MTAITRTVLGVNVPVLVSEIKRRAVQQELLLADGLMLLNRGSVDQRLEIAAIFREITGKELFLPVDTTGYDEHQLITLREKAKELRISGLYIHGSNVDEAIQLLSGDRLIIGTTVPLPSDMVTREHATEMLARRIQAGCTSLLIAPWVKAKDPIGFLQGCQEKGMDLPPVLHGILPVESKTKREELQSRVLDAEPHTIDEEVQSFRQAATQSALVTGVYANCTSLETDADIGRLMEKLTISKQ